MKKQLTALTLAAGLSAISFPAFASLDEPTDKTEPVRMTDQQLDEITAGALINVVTRLRNVQFTDVDVNVNTAILTLASSKKHDGKKHDGKKYDMKKHDGKRRY